LEPYVQKDFNLEFGVFTRFDVEELVYVLTIEEVGDCSPGPIGINADRIEDCVEEIGLGDPEISVSPLTINYGAQIIEGIYTEIVTITNEGNAGLLIESIVSDDESFIVGDYPSPFVIGVEESVQVEISFNPLNILEYSGIVTIQSNDLDEPFVNVNVLGTGIWANLNGPFIFVEPTLFEFDGCEPVIYPLRIRNIGGGGSSLIVIDLVHPILPFIVEDFEGIHLNPGDFYEVDVTFSPDVPGTYEDTLVIRSNSGGAVDHYTYIPLNGICSA